MKTASVIMNTYQHSQFIEEAIKSILSQDYSPVELIVVPVRSDVATMDILSGELGKSLKVVVSEYPSITHQMNLGFYAATGEFAQLFCSDDVLLSGALKGVTSFMEEHALSLAYPEYYYVDARLRRRKHQPIPEFDAARLQRNCYITDVSTVRRKVMLSYLPMRFGDRRNRIWRVWKEFTRDHPDAVRRYPHPTFFYRQHSRNEHVKRASPEVGNPRFRPQEKYE